MTGFGSEFVLSSHLEWRCRTTDSPAREEASRKVFDTFGDTLLRGEVIQRPLLPFGGELRGAELCEFNPTFLCCCAQRLTCGCSCALDQSALCNGLRTTLQELFDGLFACASNHATHQAADTQYGIQCSIDRRASDYAAVDLALRGVFALCLENFAHVHRRTGGRHTGCCGRTQSQSTLDTCGTGSQAATNTCGRHRTHWGCGLQHTLTDELHRSFSKFFRTRHTCKRRAGRVRLNDLFAVVLQPRTYTLSTQFTDGRTQLPYRNTAATL